jgi:glycosyltransferase involved in cell wall biosynthesis
VQKRGEVVDLTAGAPKATGVRPATGDVVGPRSGKQRWSVRRKREVVLRLLRGESMATLFREPGVEIYRLEKWRDQAMAAGLPVLASTACGGALDLVQEGGNGFTFDPFDVADPARFLVKISFGEADLKVMDEASRRIIANWTPEVLAQHPFQAVAAARAAKTARNR